MDEEYVSVGPKRRIEGVWMPKERYDGFAELLEAANRVLHEIFMNSGAPDIEARTTEALGRLAEAIAKAEGRQ